MGESYPGQAVLCRPTKQPTVMDRRFRGDPWVEGRSDGTLALCLGNYALAAMPGVTLDLPHFNHLLDRLRHTSRGRG